MTNKEIWSRSPITHCETQKNRQPNRNEPRDRGKFWWRTKGISSSVESSSVRDLRGGSLRILAGDAPPVLRIITKHTVYRFVLLSARYTQRGGFNVLAAVFLLLEFLQSLLLLSCQILPLWGAHSNRMREVGNVLLFCDYYYCRVL